MTDSTIQPSPIVNTPGVKNTSRPYFASIDGIRGILALLVAIYHADWHTYLIDETFMGQAYTILDLFFIFSGFLMFRLYGQSIDDAKSAKSFMLKRFIRLYPLHIFTFALLLGFNLLRLWGYKTGLISFDEGDIMPFSEQSAENMGSVVTHILMINALGMHDALSFNWPSWTISAEFFVYLVFIWIMLYLRPVKNWHFALLMGYAIAIFAYLASVAPNMDVTYDYGFFRCLGGFLVGMVLCRLYVIFEARREALSVNVWTLLEVLTLVVYVAFLYYAKGKWQFLHAPFSALMVFVFAFDGGRIAQFLSHKIFAYLAKISFSVYMCHAFIGLIFHIFGKKVLDRLLGEGWDIGILGDLYLIPYLLTVLVFSHFAWKYVEDASARYLRARWLKPSVKLVKRPA